MRAISSFVVLICCALMSCPSVCQRLSMGFKSGLLPGQSRCFIPFSSSRLQPIIVIQCLKDRQVTSNSIRASLNLPYSSRTVQRRLFRSGLVAGRPRKKPLLNKKMRKNRLEWAKKRQSWTVDQWKQVIFSDESRFNVGRNDSI